MSDVLRKITQRSYILKIVLDFNNLTFITELFKDKNNKLKRLFQSINDKKGENIIIDLHILYIIGSIV